MKEKMDQIFEDLFWHLAKDGLACQIDNVPGYNPKAQFVAGKTMNFCAYTYLNRIKGGPKEEEGQRALKKIIADCSDLEMETWGILHALIALHRLADSGDLEKTAESQTIRRLQAALKWESFVDPAKDYALINKPSNYYGVAYGISRYRELLGWEKGTSEILLAKLIRQIKDFSGDYQFMDETKGEGRFDRYSILIPAEITATMQTTGVQVPPMLQEMLAKSARLVLAMQNNRGTGFSYGRSIGLYGDTAVLQILGTAVTLPGLLTSEEVARAKAYSRACIQEIYNFWYDETMQSFNMWKHGRGTDGYRNIHRILGENLSVNMQVAEVLEQWKSRGIDLLAKSDHEVPVSESGRSLQCISFADLPYSRKLFLYRDGQHIWSLPFINGGTPYYAMDPYLPVPRENYVLEACPDVRRGGLVPRLFLSDGRILAPLAAFDRIESAENGRDYVLTIYQKALCLIEGKSPTYSQDFQVVTTYRLAAGQISREDEFIMQTTDDSEISFHMELGYEHMGGEPEQVGEEEILFREEQGIQTFSAKGYGRPCVRSIDSTRVGTNTKDYSYGLADPADSASHEDESFHTPHGPIKYQILFSTAEIKSRPGDRIHTMWTLTYGGAGKND